MDRRPAPAPAPPMPSTEAMERQQFAGGAHAVLLSTASALAAGHAQRVASSHFEARLRAVAAGAGVLALGGVALLLAATPARLPAGIALAVLAMLPVRGLVRALFIRARLRQVTAPMDDILATPLSAAMETPEPPAAEPGWVLQARGLTFGFNPTRAPQVCDADLDLRPGEQLGLTGPSGGGKSTLAALLAGLHAPRRGTLALARRADGAPVRVGWVHRADFFIAGTVRENLCLWADVDAGALERAVHDACLDDVLAARPGGLDAPVQLHGRNFSGGQRQRMEIARALLRDPAVLVLDEAVDGLDAVLEARLRGRLRTRGCALVIVSHRAGTLAACDRVLRVAGGRIEAHAPALSARRAKGRRRPASPRARRPSTWPRCGSRPMEWPTSRCSSAGAHRRLARRRARAGRTPRPGHAAARDRAGCRFARPGRAPRARGRSDAVAAAGPAAAGVPR
ncbi:ATP-binding cassette domain-containing protein [Ramlibacter terrae]|uniref:ATP-binding cassette domain-containing protein n=1 Tax=Ramlibacter terrae TaxID=2732511 RepID=A0ABX6P185_9BURK|nr:ATP-binding cassette domain-containing protein [Ramlibacter terrae]